MKRKGFSLIEWIGVVFFVLLCAALIYPIFAPKREYDGHRDRCMNNLKQIALGFKQYQNDFDEHFPLVAVTNYASTTYAPPYGWADALQPYIRNTQVYQCSLDKHEGQDNSGQSGFTDYWYNRNLEGLSKAKLTSSAQTVISGDGNDGTEITDARYSLSSLPPHWLTTKGSPALRHYAKNPSGANYAFADGHVKWFKPEQIKTEPIHGAIMTFSPR